VLKSPTADLADTSPAVRAITLRHLLTNTSGYGMVLTECPLQRAMADSEVDAGVDPVTFGADEWLARLAALPLAFQPGEGWRYHHSFGILGILIARVAGRPLQDHLADDLLGPLGLRDTGLWVSAGSVARLPASYRHTDSGLVELEPAAGGFYAGQPAVRRESRRARLDGPRLQPLRPDAGRRRPVRGAADRVGGAPPADDQRPGTGRRQDAGQLLPGFWDGTGWGFGVGSTRGPAGRPLRVVRRTGHQLLRRPRRHRGCPADPGGGGRMDAGLLEEFHALPDAA
jgi:CubicO group peptidase (beta-lactamase class C family)